MIYITRTEKFAAAHKLSREDWSEEKNRDVFGKCSNPNWHGHNYTLDVTVSGTADELTGFVLDLRMLSELIHKKVIDKVDHRNLNLDVDFMKGKMASTEVFAMAIWEQLEQDIAASGASLYKVRLQETDKNYVEYYGGKLK